jgi:hypothetical protein
MKKYAERERLVKVEMEKLFNSRGKCLQQLE